MKKNIMATLIGATLCLSNANAAVTYLDGSGAVVSSTSASLVSIEWSAATGPGALGQVSGVTEEATILPIGFTITQLFVIAQPTGVSPATANVSLSSGSGVHIYTLDSLPGEYITNDVSAIADAVNVLGFENILSYNVNVGFDATSAFGVRGFAAAVPEPSSTALLGLGTFGLLLRRKR